MTTFSTTRFQLLFHPLLQFFFFILQKLLFAFFKTHQILHIFLFSPFLSLNSKDIFFRFAVFIATFYFIFYFFLFLMPLKLVHSNRGTFSIFLLFLSLHSNLKEKKRGIRSYVHRKSFKNKRQSKKVTTMTATRIRLRILD